MEEVLLRIAGAQEVMAWGLVLIATLNLMGLVLTVTCIYFVRESQRMLREMREDSKRMSFYLFPKLGPADTR